MRALLSALRPLHSARWLCALGLVCLSFASWAQEAGRCEPRIQSIQVAKADSQGPVPFGQTLDWTTVQLRDIWRDRWPNYVGAAWYRIDWERSCADQPVALTLNSIIMAGEVFINRDLLWRDTHLQEPLSRSWNVPRYWLLPESALHAGVNQVWIRVHGRADDSGGLGSVLIGEPDALHHYFERLWWSHRTAVTISLAVAAVLSAIFGFSWLQNRKESVFGWFSLHSLFWTLLLTSALSTEIWPFPSSLAFAIASTLVYLGFVVTFCIFVFRFAEIQLPRLEKAIWAVTAVAVPVVLFTPAHLRHLLPILTNAYALLIIGIGLWFPWHAYRTRKLEHIVFALCIPVVMLLGMHDLLSVQGHLGAAIPLLPYSLPISMLALALVLGRKITLNMRRIERFNIELNDSVNRACDDLSTTLEREHTLALRHSLLQERMQISHDLHDSLGGSLVRSIAYVEQAREPLPNKQVLSMLKLMRDDLRQMIDAGASAHMHAPETPAQWVAPMRHRFGMLFEEMDLSASWSLPPEWITQPSAIQCLTLTRVLEEALTNVVKHSRATKVSIALELPSPRELKLLITDNGQGFDVHTIQINSMGVGMRSMLARVERINGTLRIESQPGATTLEVQASLRERVTASGEIHSAPMPL